MKTTRYTHVPLPPPPISMIRVDMTQTEARQIIDSLRKMGFWGQPNRELCTYPVVSDLLDELSRAINQ